MKKLQVPAPVIHTTPTPYGMAYAWKIERLGLFILGNTRLDCMNNFVDAVKEEFPQQYKYAGEVL